MGHPVSVVAEGSLGHDFAAWQANSFALLDAATHLVILHIDGWQESVGVQAEVARARLSGKSIWALLPDGENGWRLDMYAHLGGRQ